MTVISAARDEWQLDAYGLRHTDPFGTIEELRRDWTVGTVKDMHVYAGTYVSADAEATLTAAAIDGRLVLKRRPDTTIALTPLYADAFSADHGLGTVIFHWDSNGRVSDLSVVQDRVWNMPFRKSEVGSQK